MRPKPHRRVVDLLFGVVFVIAVLPDARAASCADPFAPGDEVLDFHLRMSRQNWLDLRHLPAVGPEPCEQQYPYLPVDFRCGDEDAWIEIGARRKRGDQRGRDTDQKPPLKLDFNRYVPGQSWPLPMGRLGMRKLSLNNGQSDTPGGQLTALLTEHVAWKLMGRVFPAASKSGYVRVFIHFTDDDTREYHGLYVLIEDIDRRAVRRRFGDDRGTLLKTTSSCRHRPVFDDGPPNEANDTFRAFGMEQNYEHDAASWRRLVEESLRLEELLKVEATRDILANGDDSLTGRSYSNFLVYDPRVGRRMYFPWDLDDAFRPFPNNDREADVPLTRECSPLGARTRCHPAIEELYWSTICDLINGPLSSDALGEVVRETDKNIRPLIRDERALVWGGVDPLEPGREDNYLGEYERLMSWTQERIPAIRAELASRGASCAPAIESDRDGGTSSPVPADVSQPDCTCRTTRPTSATVLYVLGLFGFFVRRSFSGSPRTGSRR